MTGIGVSVVFVVWLILFLVLSVICFMTRPKGRKSPRCGEDVRKGLTRCKACGFDFAAASGQPVA